MFYWIRETLARQLAALALILATGAAVLAATGYAPLVRPSARALSTAALAFSLLLVFSAVLLFIGLRYPGSGLKHSLAGLRRELVRKDLATRLGSAVFAASGEEFLLRGIIFGYFMRTALWPALIATAAISALCYSRGRRNWYVAFLHGLEGLWYAMLYYRHHSLASIVLVRLAREVIFDRILASKRAEALLGLPRIHWREFYDRSRTTRIAVPRV